MHRIFELIQELNLYRDAYYNNNQSMVSDQEYDALFDELSRLEKETGIIISTSPTQTVGYEVKSKLNKVEHPIPLLSLDKTKSVTEILEFMDGQKCLAMLKADGLTIKLVYENGKLVEGSTRGSGTQGEEISHNVKVFRNVPLEIPFANRIVIVGEAVIHYDDFDKINEKIPDGEKYKNPRNLASGSVRQLDSKVCSERSVSFYAFGALEGLEEDSKFDRFSRLIDFGFDLITHVKIDEPSLDGLSETINNLRELATDDYIPIDGLVFTYDSVKYSDMLGKTSHHPLHSKAFKFKDEIAETTLREIEWSVGKTGAITPVAIFDEVEIDGTNVTRASMHNISIMEELQIGIGDSIGVIKANQIIPQVTENYTKSNNFELPEHCPVCGEETVVKKEKKSKVLMCNNEGCEAKFLKKLEHFVSRDAMNIEGLSEATLEKFVQEGYIKDFVDIFKLEQYKNNISTMQGFGLRSFNNLISSINKARETELHRIIYSMSIPLIGKSASKAISKYVKHDFNRLIELLDVCFDWSVIEDFGALTSYSLNDWYTPQTRDLLFRLHDEVKLKAQQNVSNNYKDLSNMVFVVTGEFENFKPRKVLEDLIVSCNGKMSSSVSAKTSVLITNDTTSGTKKNKEAQRLGVPIMNELEFMKFIGMEA